MLTVHRRVERNTHKIISWLSRNNHYSHLGYYFQPSPRFCLFVLPSSLFKRCFKLTFHSKLFHSVIENPVESLSSSCPSNLRHHCFGLVLGLGVFEAVSRVAQASFKYPMWLGLRITWSIWPCYLCHLNGFFLFFFLASNYVLPYDKMPLLGGWNSCPNAWEAKSPPAPRPLTAV